MIPVPANATVRILLALGGLALMLAALWWAAIWPRQQLAAERAAHAGTKARHAEVLQGLAEAAAEVARKAARAREAFAEATAESESRYEKGVADAYERGRATAAGIAAGTVRVREVWRERECPAAAGGQGTEPAAGPAGVSGDRAAAIGRVLGIGGAADAGYARAIERLNAAQAIVDQCFEEPAR